MPVPRDRRYLKTHEWHQLADAIITIGISKFAVDQLTDITYVELPTPGTIVRPDEAFGEIESVKATSDLYAGVTGEVTEINKDLAGAPELVNSDPYGAGWIVRVRIDDPAQYNALISPEDYERMIGEA